MTKDREKQLLERIEQLERKVAELQAAPAIHHHYHSSPPVYAPAYQPQIPGWPYPITCGGPSYTIGAASWS